MAAFGGLTIHNGMDILYGAPGRCRFSRRARFSESGIVNQAARGRIDILAHTIRKFTGWTTGKSVWSVTDRGIFSFLFVLFFISGVFLRFAGSYEIQWNFSIVADVGAIGLFAVTASFFLEVVLKLPVSSRARAKKRRSRRENPPIFVYTGGIDQRRPALLQPREDRWEF